MSTGPTQGAEAVPEADQVEQQQSAGFEEDRFVPVAERERAVPEASEADLSEQAIEVPLDDEER